MLAHALPLVFALLVWWAGTGLVLFLDQLPARTYRWSMAGASALALSAMAGLAVTGDDASVSSAYIAFACGVAVWGWHEMAFLMGYLAGPRRSAATAVRGGWRHVLQAIEAILFHELAILATLAAILALTWGGANQVGAGTFAILWVMRLSAKLNVYLGVPNLTEEFLPAHLKYLKSFFARKPMNLLFPVSVSLSTVATLWLAQMALAPGADAFAVAGYGLLASLMGLAVLEHWFLVLPLPVTALWGPCLPPEQLDTAPPDPRRGLAQRPIV